MTITDWGHRGVPNVLLNAALTTKAIPSKKAGTWNAAHFKNKKYDSLSSRSGARLALSDQRKFAKQIELLLLDQTPVIFPYFYNSLNAGSQEGLGIQSRPARRDLSEQDVARPERRRAMNARRPPRICAAAVGVSPRTAGDTRSMRQSPTRC